MEDMPKGVAHELTQEQISGYLAHRASVGTPEREIRREKQQLLTLYVLLGNRALTAEILQEWRNTLDAQGLSKRTVRDYVITINRYLRYYGQDDLCFSKGCAKNLAGKRFGQLTVLDQTGENAPDRSRIWRCRCDCGREITAPANKLLRGRYSSCGCQKKERLRKINGYVDDTCLKLVLSDVVRRDNASGERGVYQRRDGWAAFIQYKKRIYYLGQYKQKKDAIRARKQAEAWVKDDARTLWDMLPRES